MERYKAVIQNNKLYHEVELEADTEKIRIGTEKNCAVRFDRGMFFEEFNFLLVNQGESWMMVCGENNYISEDSILKLTSKELSHGDRLYLKDKKSNIEIITISFMLDFEYETKDYDRVIDIDGVSTITIGGISGSHIKLEDPLIGSDQITITNRGGRLMLNDNNTQYGIYVNGRRIQDEAEIHNYDFFSIIGYSFYFKYGKLYTQRNACMIVENLHSEIHPESDGRFHYPVFNRNTRIRVPVPNEEITILDPPASPEKNKQNILLQLLPTVAMMGVTVMLASQMGSGSTMAIRSIAMVAIAILVAIIGLITDKRTFKKDTKHRDITYRAYIDKKREEVQGKRLIEKGILEDTFTSPEQELLMVEQFSSDLFDRRPGDNDFLRFRLGTGALSSSQPVVYKEKETLEIGDELTQMPIAVANEFRALLSAPIVVDGEGTGAIGIVGARPRLYEMLKNLLLDITTRHYFEDVQLFLMTKEDLAASVSWARLLPHLNNERIGIRNIICDEESKNTLFEYLYKELSMREANKTTSPRIVVLSYSDPGMKSHPISSYFEKATEIGVTFLFFEEKKHNLPLGCGQVVMLQSNDNTGTVVAQDDDTAGMSFSYIPIDDSSASFFAQKLAPVYCEEVSLESNLTKNITLFQLFNIYATEDLNLDQRWSSSQIHKSMAAPLGVDSKNEIIALDLHEKFHGPHGLVAGTTGSGKSEILQSYILSMATLFHPYEVGFVIIDFKGGGMVNQFKDLPHLNGAITNIDGREVNRSLSSIKAELRKRQALFAQANVNHINAYIQLFKKGEVETPLPHLILVVDEFAELKMDQPEFMKELVSAARIGRSLGVHLILATQKPSGVVDDQIWSNSKFKLCLKVQNQQDSNEVLKSPLAAEIREPGRAYFQVGNNEMFLLFQSAYSGAPAVTSTDQKKRFKVSRVSTWGKKQIVYEQKPNKTSEETETQLDALVRHIADFANMKGINPLPGICMPPLQELITYSESKQSDAQLNDISVVMGIYDDPDNQLQTQHELEMLGGNTFIVGASQYGKTAILQLIIRGLAESYSPEEVSIYIMDFASMALKIFDDLNHVGGVITPSDDVKLKTFFRMISREIAVRKDKLSKLGLASFASYKEAGHTDLPFIVIMLDNITAFRELYDSYDDELLNICREGLAVGVNIVVTTVQTRTLGYKYLTNFGNRIALYCNSKDEYNNMFERCRMEPKDVPGRGLISINKEIYEYQNYLPFEGDKEIDRVNDVRAFIGEISKGTRLQARRVPEVPDVLAPEYITETLNAPAPYTLIAGMDFDTVDAVPINMLKMGYFAISGREKSGKTNFVRYLFSCMAGYDPEKHPVEAYIIDDYERKFEALTEHSLVQGYFTEMRELDNVLKKLNEESVRRREVLKTDGAKAVKKLPLLFLVVQNSQFFEPNGISKESAALCKNLLKTAKDIKLFMMFTNLENAPIPYGGTEIQKQIKETKNIIFFDDLVAFKPFDIQMSDLRSNKKPIDPGDAFFITERSIVRMKTPLLEGK